jgi:hypothetical protein
MLKKDLCWYKLRHGAIKRKQSRLVDYAFGYREAYNPNMKRWFVEDTVTSALMRVMALVMGGTEKATKETMSKVNDRDTSC